LTLHDQKLGVVANQKRSIFWPRDEVAIKVAAKHCKGFRRCRFGGYLVPKEKYWEVYESLSHDPEHPQSMNLINKLQSMTFVDTPDA